MATIREQIIEAAVALVNTGAPAGVPLCVRTQMQPNEQAQLPAITCFPFREIITSTKPSGRWGPYIDRVMYLRFVCYNSGAPADQSLDDILAWLTQSLGGQQFGGLAADCVESEINWQFDEGNFQVAAAAIDFKIDYQTLRNDATAS